MLILARRGARNLTRKSRAIRFSDHHAVTNLQAKFIGLGNDTLTTGIRANDEFHCLTTGGALFNGAAGNTARKRADHTTHGARAPIATDGAPQKATADSAGRGANTAA
jgi:hypothetical protein